MYTWNHTNVAYKKPTTATPVLGYGWLYNCIQYNNFSPQGAVDGYLENKAIGDCSKEGYWGGQINSGENGVYWEVDLQQGYDVLKVVYYKLKDFESFGYIVRALDPSRNQVCSWVTMNNNVDAFTKGESFD